MESREYIDSGILELYVYGLLSESENLVIAKLAKENNEIYDEIQSIEKSVLNLSSSFAPFLSADNYEKIKSKLDIDQSSIISINSRKNKSTYLGWAASIVLLLGVGYLYFERVNFKNEIVNLENKNSELNEVIVESKNKSEQNKSIINVLKDSNNSVIALTGQAISPESSAKIYWNKKTETVFVDASQLPEPPNGMVYQVWSIKLKPSLTPTSIGLLTNFKENENRVFKVESTSNAEAFGITLEPAGGSKSPTMEKLYTLGSV